MGLEFSSCCLTHAFALLQGFRVVGRVLERSKKFTKGGRPAFGTAQSSVKQGGQGGIGLALEHCGGEGKGLVVHLQLPSEIVTEVHVLVVHVDGRGPVVHAQGLLMKHLPRQADEATAGRKVNAICLGAHAFCENFEESLQIDVPGVQPLHGPRTTRGRWNGRWGRSAPDARPRHVQRCA